MMATGETCVDRVWYYITGYPQNYSYITILSTCRLLVVLDLRVEQGSRYSTVQCNQYMYLCTTVQATRASCTYGTVQDTCIIQYRSLCSDVQITVYCVQATYLLQCS
jgi:hypothetical protein